MNRLLNAEFYLITRGLFIAFIAPFVYLYVVTL